MLVFLTNVSFGVTKKVLFIGNSYTFTNNMPQILDSIAAAFGDTLIFDMSAPGGYTMQQHTTNSTTISKIFSQKWDIVVIHEQSQMPAFPPSQVATDVYPYAARLDSMVHANDTCTQTMFMMTWGHANGDPSNCGSYPVICSYTGMQFRLRESYLQMGIDNHACVAPVGMAFKVMMDSVYTPWLFISDSSHPLPAGSYLEAAVLYSSIYHKSSLNCPYTLGLAPASVYRLQRIATKVVFDSLDQWQQNGHYPYAGFGRSTSGSTVTFTNHSPVGTGHTWSFGDAHTDTAANPTHVYSATGTYTVTNTVHTNCFTETLTDTVHITVSHASVNGVEGQPSNIIIIQSGGGMVSFMMPGAGYDKLEIYNCNGSMIRRYDSQSAKIDDVVTPGFYIYRWYSLGGKLVETGKIAVY